MPDFSVSAYITTFNRPESLDLAIKSVIEQTKKCSELIIVDDNSSMPCINIIKKYLLSIKIIYIRLEKNMGACHARNIAIKTAQGKYIAGLDDDDQWHPERIDILLRTYNSGEYSLVYSDDYLTKNGSIIKTTSKKNITSINDILYENIIGNQIFTERYKILDCGLFDEKLTAAQDYDMWLRIIEKYGAAKKSNIPLQYINIGENDRITKSNKRFSGYFLFYKKHKSKMTESHRKYQILNIKYMCSKKISIFTYVSLFEPKNISRRVKIYLNCVAQNKRYEY